MCLFSFHSCCLKSFMHVFFALQKVYAFAANFIIGPAKSQNINRLSSFINSYDCCYSLFAYPVGNTSVLFYLVVWANKRGTQTGFKFVQLILWGNGE